MINMLLALSLMVQDADVTVMGRGRRQGGEFELTITGKGKGLQDGDVVSLKFRRLSTRMNWEEGLLVTAPVEEAAARAATVEEHAFVHHERFAVPGEVEVRIGRSHPDGAPVDGREIRRVFRLSSLSEESNAIAGAAKRFDAALHGLGQMLEDIDLIRCESASPSRKQSRLQKRIDWRSAAYRQEIADSFLAASADALTRWMSDVESALELMRNGKDATTLLSSLSGKPFAWEEARAQLEAIESVSLRERALLVIDAAGAVAQEIGAVVHAEAAGTWERAEKEFTRALDALRDGDQAWRSGSRGERYGTLVDGGGDSLEQLVSLVRQYLEAGDACLHCPKPNDAHFLELSQSILDRAATLENRVRGRK